MSPGEHTACVDVQPRLLADTLAHALESRGFRLVATGGAAAEVRVTHDPEAVADLVILLPRKVDEPGRVIVRGSDIGVVIEDISTLDGVLAQFRGSGF